MAETKKGARLNETVPGGYFIGRDGEPHNAMGEKIGSRAAKATAEDADAHAEAQTAASAAPEEPAARAFDPTGAGEEDGDTPTRRRSVAKKSTVKRGG